MGVLPGVDEGSPFFAAFFGVTLGREVELIGATRDGTNTVGPGVVDVEVGTEALEDEVDCIAFAFAADTGLSTSTVVIGFEGTADEENDALATQGAADAFLDDAEHLLGREVRFAADDPARAATGGPEYRVLGEPGGVGGA